MATEVEKKEGAEKTENLDLDYSFSVIIFYSKLIRLGI